MLALRASTALQTWLYRSVASLKAERRRLRELGSDQSGATMIEYGVMITLITVALIVLIDQVGGHLVTAWTELEATLQ